MLADHVYRLGTRSEPAKGAIHSQGVPSGNRSVALRSAPGIIYELEYMYW